MSKKKKKKKLQVKLKTKGISKYVSRNAMIRSMQKSHLVGFAIVGWSILAGVLALIFHNKTACIIIGVSWFLICGNIILDEKIRRIKIKEKLFSKVKRSEDV